MARKKWIDKKSAQNFTLVYRPQNDPLIHDETASSMVLNPTAAPNSNKVKKLDDLASELGSEIEHVRANEGEAANYGIYYDDTEYDYMQHMRDLGSSSGEAIFVEAQPLKSKIKGKGKQTLEEALRNVDLEAEQKFQLDADILPSKNLTKVTYQSQQDVPDVLAGFQPDMDPRLREVLEALEDEAYVDDEDEIFTELAKDGEEIQEEEFVEGAWEDEDEEWESDDTARPSKEYREAADSGMGSQGENMGDDGDGDWMADFKKFKQDQKKKAAFVPPSDIQSSIMTTTTNGGRHKKRKGALTNPSTYSMTSSSLFRTEGLTDLDNRFEKLEERYNQDMDDLASVSAASSTASSVQGPLRSDFDNIMDDFLGGYSMSGKKHVKKGKYQSGMDQLEEIRKGLGPARVKAQKG